MLFPLLRLGDKKLRHPMDTTKRVTSQSTTVEECLATLEKAKLVCEAKRATPHSPSSSKDLPKSPAHQGATEESDVAALIEECSTLLKQLQLGISHDSGTLHYSSSRLSGMRRPQKPNTPQGCSPSHSFGEVLSASVYFVLE